jgi:hypothetical protein
MERASAAQVHGMGELSIVQVVDIHSYFLTGLTVF